ncbi:hypothetical protein WICMUC_004425 [Wickerhamomyces mucosus]|uniref:3-oxo-5-alpha-steroid 4-dehydrogenase C-terminal domain-containing protein n=1 Tax=Wickerhamomyces mucosus TaxID=1378264 RepID=A0A9P8TAR4_9ASCO|nr:hypothetical protein WICMUC_004425 [Wickerhamomyces mucosus]
MSSIVVKSRSKSLKSDSYDSISSIDQLLKQISKNNNRINPNRIRITNEFNNLIKTDKELIESKEINVKDLGPQIGWRTVYIIEYLGPIIIHYLAYNYLFDQPIKTKLIYQLNLIHYFKREIENIFVHKFSNSTMPLFNLFKNSGHYWALGGSLIAIYGDILNIDIPNYDPTKYTEILTYIWVISEFFNAITHIQLRLLGDKSIRKGLPKQAPKGGFFEIFTAPNYTFEIYGWITIFLLRPNITTLIFLIVGATQMFFWVQKKNKIYGQKKSFLIPFIF